MRAMLCGALAACAFAACDSSNPTATDDIATYRQLAVQTNAAATSYGATMMGPTVTLAGCAGIHDAYDRQVRPWIAQMVTMSGAMDAFMHSHQGAMFDDMSCASSAMMRELDSHQVAACTSADLAADRAEAERHANLMGGYAAHVQSRCGEMITGLSNGDWQWSPMMNGCFGGGPMMDGGWRGGPMMDGGLPPQDPLALGQQIFDSGRGLDGQPIPRTSAFAMRMMGGCASCHGIDGHGLRMMMFTSPNITYFNLTDPSGMLDPDGSRGPIYTDKSIRRAVVDGIGADGEALANPMPRWQLQDAEWAGLLAYLETLR